MSAARIRFYKPAGPLQPYLSAYYSTDHRRGDPVEDLDAPGMGQHPLHLERLLDFPECQELGRQSHHPGSSLRADQPDDLRR